MKVLLNGVTCELSDGHTVAALLQATRYADRKVAIEVNREIVPRSQHAQRILRDGDQVEIVVAMGGG